MPVSRITAFLFHTGGHDSPVALTANSDKSFKGCDTYSPGFIFDLTDNEGTTGTIDEMRALLAKDQNNARRIVPYMGGEDVLNSPTVSNYRYVIDFDDMTEEESRKWPDLMSIVEQRVRPERLSLKTQQSATRLQRLWWQFGYAANGMRQMAKERDRFLMHPFYSGHLAFVFLPSNVIVATPNSVFAFSKYDGFSVLQSRVHEAWVRFVASSFKDDLRYSPTDCFETFPFPENFETDAKLEVVGKDYYEFRAALMLKNNEGLTKTYNRFHDPNETSAEIKKLRELHAAMDRAVLDAYGWTDLQPTCEFLLDYDEEEEDEEDTGKARKKQKPWRHRWPDEFRDLVLARLLELNKQRAETEKLSGAAAEAKQKKPGRRKGKPKDDGPPLFG